MAVLVDLDGVAVRRADRVLFEGLSLTVATGDRVGVVGSNGTGKSTLLRLIAGVELPGEGQIRRGRGSRVGYLDQVPVLPLGTVREVVGQGWESEAALDRLGMASRVDSDVAQLSGGQAKRLALAQALAQPCELLVLDEPTNHLDLGAIAWLEQWLSAFRGGLVLVTHDRYLLDRLTTRMLELDRGHTYSHDGGYASYLESRVEREEHAMSAEASRRNLARRELAWLRRGAQARSRKPQARVDAARRLLESRPEASSRPADLELSLGTPRLGSLVVECTDLAFRYSREGPDVVRGANLTLARRERLGVVGANGSGKSTLLDLMAGNRLPTAGTVTVGPTVTVGYYRQRGEELDLGARVQDLVAGAHRAPGNQADIDLMKRFWFTGELPFARVETLSGGERRRLQLLMVLAQHPNVLMLDEPTNDLDLETLSILEDFLESWPGALVVVSHDRTFLDRTTERLVALQQDGSLGEVAGGLAGWLARLTEPSAVSVLPPPSSGDTPPSRSTLAGRSVSSPPQSGAGSIGRRLRQSEKEVSTLQRRLDRLADGLGSATGHVEIAQLGSEVAAVQAELEEAEQRWLELAEEAESSRSGS